MATSLNGFVICVTNESSHIGLHIREFRPTCKTIVNWKTYADLSTCRFMPGLPAMDYKHSVHLITP